MKKIVLIVVILIITTSVFYFLSNKGKEPKNETELATIEKVFEENKNIIPTNNIQTINGMKIEILKQGTGEGAKNGDTTTVHYTGTLENSTKFDSSLDRNQPFSFVLGTGQVIQGWELGIAGMKVGEKRKLTIPSELGYGSAGIGPIPPNATLIFEVELLGINQ